MKDISSYIDRVLEAYRKNSYERVTLLAMNHYLQYELASKCDKDRAKQLALMLHTFAKANNYNELAFTSLITIYNVIADCYETTDYRLLIADTETYDIRVVDDIDYALYVTDSVYDICDIDTESVFYLD